MVRRLLQSPLDRTVVEAYRLDRHDNSVPDAGNNLTVVVEAYRLDRHDNFVNHRVRAAKTSCRSLSFG